MFIRHIGVLFSFVVVVFLPGLGIRVLLASSKPFGNAPEVFTFFLL